jgi:hypothetical protein
VSGIGPSEIAFFGQEVPATSIWYNGLKIHKETSYKYMVQTAPLIYLWMQKLVEPNDGTTHPRIQISLINQDKNK